MPASKIHGLIFRPKLCMYWHTFHMYYCVYARKLGICTLPWLNRHLSRYVYMQIPSLVLPHNLGTQLHSYESLTLSSLGLRDAIPTNGPITEKRMTERNWRKGAATALSQILSLRDILQ